MASGHVNRISKAEHMAAPTNTAYVKKALANSEPSTHGTWPTWAARTPVHKTVIATCRALRLPQLEIGRNRAKFSAGRLHGRQEEFT